MQNYNNSTGVSYTTAFFMLIGFSILGFVLSGLLGALYFSNVAGVGMAEMSDALKDPKHAGSIRFIQIISVIISMLLPAIAVAAIVNRRPFQLLGFRERSTAREFGVVLAIMAVSLIVVGGLGAANKAIPVPDDWRVYFERLEDEYNEQIKIILDLKDIKGYLLSLLIMAVLPALCEETLFRGGLQNFLTRATGRPWLSILIVSIIFSLVHFSFFGFLPRLFLGMMLGYIFHITRNLWYSIAAHFLNNALAVTIIYAMTRNGMSVEDSMKEEITTYWGLLALPLLVYLFLLLRKVKYQNIETTPTQTINPDNGI